MKIKVKNYILIRYEDLRDPICKIILRLYLYFKD